MSCSVNGTALFLIISCLVQGNTGLRVHQQHLTTVWACRYSASHQQGPAEKHHQEINVCNTSKNYCFIENKLNISKKCFYSELKKLFVLVHNIPIKTLLVTYTDVYKENETDIQFFLDVKKNVCLTQ